MFVRLRNILVIRGMDSHNALFFQETVETGNGAGTALHKFYPENDEAGIRVTSAHIEDEFNLLRGVLAEMIVRHS